MIIEYICCNEECKHSFCDVKVIIGCKCPVCGSQDIECEDWEGIE